MATDTLDRLQANCSGSRHNGRGRRVACVLAFMLALPASASAGQPFTIDSGGQNPHVAVGEDGTGHFVWESVGVERAVGYCQVPRGGTACTKTQRWPGMDGREYRRSARAPAPRRADHHHRREGVRQGRAGVRGRRRHILGAHGDQQRLPRARARL